MYYVLEFANHIFVTCENEEEIRNAITEFLTHIGVNEDDIEIIDCSDSDIRYSVEEFNCYFNC